MELLLTVKEYFLITGRGMLITPTLDYAKDRLFIPFSAQVTIQSPDNEAITLTAEFFREHDHIAGGGYIFPVLFPEGTKELVPVGSQVFVSKELFQYLRGELHTDTDSIRWLEPWSAINNSKSGTIIERELYKEVSKGHVLYRQPMRAIGRRQDKDDFVFEFGLSSQLAVVHLTFASKPELPPFPTMHMYHDITEFIDMRMKPDHEAFKGNM